jgi:hypothetical protein
MNKIKFFISIVALLFTTMHISYANNDTKTSVNAIKVLSVSSVKTNKQIKRAVVGDFIKVNLSESRFLDTLSLCSDSSKAEITLAINGARCSDIPYYTIDYKTKSIIFLLDTASQSLQKILKFNNSYWGSVNLSALSLSYNSNTFETDVTNFKLSNNSNKSFLYGVITFVLIILLFIIIIHKTNILRLSGKGSPFSLAQSQLAWWSIIIFVSIFYIWFVTGTLPELSNSILILLGISASTTGGSKYIGSFLNKTGETTTFQSEGFIEDIISDDDSSNIHRVQLVICTLLMGFFFLIKVLSTRTFYEFPDTYLYLTGLSSGAYVFLKLSESKPTTRPDSEATGEAPAMG